MLVAVVTLFLRFKGDYHEQALMDSIELSTRLKQVKAGKAKGIGDVKVKNVDSIFALGAWAVMSKNLLLMKKTRTLMSTNEIIILVVYAVITIFTDMGYGFFSYMMVIYIFATLQQSDLVQDLKNYQIYLIPDKPINKLLAVLIPQLVKSFLVVTIAMVAMGLFYSASINEILQYLVMMYGYVLVFMSATILSTRLLKSRSNRTFENIMRMLICIVCSLPSIVIIITLMNGIVLVDDPMFVLSYSSLIMNFILSILIIIGCSSMMNGRELNDE